jgi:hypothetical protein
MIAPAIDTFDVDAALMALDRRAFWSRWAIAAAALIAALLWWAVARDAQFVLSNPLHPVVQSVHIPGPAVHENGLLERAMTVTERAFAFMAFAVATGALVVLRTTSGLRKRAALLACGCLLILLLFAQWAYRTDGMVNLDLLKLAEARQYTELHRRTVAKPQMPYAQYIGAQALVLSGQSARLRAEYGPWLNKWAEQAKTKGYANGAAVVPLNRQWEGMHASPQVMRALELVAFGSAGTASSADYMVEAQANTQNAKLRLTGLAPAALIVSVLLGALAAAWLQIRRNLRTANQWIVRFDFYEQAEHAQEKAVQHRERERVAMLPIEFG